MRICHVALEPPGLHVEKQILRLLEALGDRVQLRVIVRQGSSLHLRLVNQALPTVEIRTAPSSILRATFALSDADLFHCHDDASVLATALRSALGARIVATYYADGTQLSRPLTRWCYRRADFVVIHEESLATKINCRKIESAVRTIQDVSTANTRQESIHRLGSQLYCLYATAIFGVGWSWDRDGELRLEGAKRGRHARSDWIA